MIDSPLVLRSLIRVAVLFVLISTPVLAAPGPPGPACASLSAIAQDPPPEKEAGPQDETGGEKKESEKKGGEAKKKGQGGDDRRTGEQKEKDKQLKELEKLLKSAMKRQSFDEIAYHVEQIAAVGSSRAMELVLRVGERYTDEPVRSAVVNSLVWSRHYTACMNYFVRQIHHWRNGKVERLLVLTEAFDRMDHPQASEGLIAALAVPEARVITSAVRALRHKPSKEAVAAVIELYGKVAGGEDLLAAETRITLIALTREEYRAYEDWANWWLIHRENWKPPTRQTDVAERRARTVVYRPKRDYEIPKLFGQEVASKRIVFVIDTSSSMQKRDPWEGEEGSGGGSRVRIERAKAELIKVVLDLREDTRFNIVAFNTYVSVPEWGKDDLVRATKTNKKRAVKWILSWKPEWHTNTGEAMQVAMDFDDVDTIILLSDGSPTIPGSGELDEIPPILEAIRKNNRFKKITIHTLSFPGAKISFMKTLAKDSGGTYAEIK